MNDGANLSLDYGHFALTLLDISLLVYYLSWFKASPMRRMQRPILNAIY